MMPALRDASLLATVVVIASGCTVDSEGSRISAGVEVFDSAGVSIIQNVIDRPPRLAVDETRRIGLLEGPHPYLFSQVSAVAVSESDSVFIANSQTGTVRVFAPEGEFVREFGGIGQGPHEVRGISHLWLTGDTVVIRDLRPPWKTVLFRASGDFLASWPGRQVDGSQIRTVARGEQGWIVEVWPRTRVVGAPGDSVGVGMELRTFDATDQSLGRPVFEPPRRPTYITPDGSRDQALFRVFGSAFDDRGGFYRTGTPAYEIRVYAPDGSFTRSIRRSHELRMLGASDIDEFRRLAQEVLDTVTSYGPPGTIDEQVMRAIDQQAALPLPDSWAPIRELLVSSDGHIWAENVEEVTPGFLELINIFGFDADYRTEPSTWDVFDPQGVYVGQVRLPTRFDPMAVRGLEVTGVLEDALDVEYVVTYTVMHPMQSGG